MLILGAFQGESGMKVGLFSLVCAFFVENLFVPREGSVAACGLPAIASAVAASTYPVGGSHGFACSWQYCYDLAGNLTSQGVDKGCPRGTTYTVNDAQQITAKNGSATNWSYDKIGNGRPPPPPPSPPAPG